MKQNIEATAYQLACWDAAKQARRDVGPLALCLDFELEVAARELLEAQYDWYMERAARLRRVQQ